MHSQSGPQIRNRLVRHIRGGKAFVPVDKLISNIRFEQTGIVPAGLPYSFYQQFFHLRYAQLDILEYCQDSDYSEPSWPDDYWPESPGPTDKKEWETLTENYFSERNSFCEFILDPENELQQPVADNPDHTLLRQALLVLEHTAYHTGQLHIINRLLKNS